MDARQERGLEMAKQFKIVQNGDGWVVPSATGKGRYRVHMTPEYESCDCPDFELRGGPCKHLYAVQYVASREVDVDGTVTETLQVTQTVRRTYKQNWPAYNEAQTHEQDKFQVLLHDLCRGVPDLPAPKSKRTGRPRLSVADAIFSAVFKVYSTVSGRRFMSDLREAKKREYIAKLPHFNSIFNYLEKPELTPILRDLITETSKPLKAVDVDFAVDSSGFTTGRFTRWFDHKYGVTRQQHDWVKVHIMCGVKTNIVTAVEIREKLAQDAPQLPALARATAKTFTMREISGDKAYASINNTNVIAELGATQFIPFKSIHTGAGGGLWEKMYHYFMLNRDEFLAHYHKRSNAESTFSMIKRKFGDFLRSKTDVAMINETLCKILCHNIVVLIHEMGELGINPTFWAEKPVAQEVAG